MTFWNKSKIDALIKLVTLRLPARVIASKLGTTKSAVLGKKQRLGLADKKPPKPLVKHAKLSNTLKPMPMTGCLWHDDDKGWCGKKIKEGSAYCPEHHKRVWVKRKFRPGVYQEHLGTAYTDPLASRDFPDHY